MSCRRPSRQPAPREPPKMRTEPASVFKVPTDEDRAPSASVFFKSPKMMTVAHLPQSAPQLRTCPYCPSVPTISLDGSCAGRTLPRTATPLHCVNCHVYVHVCVRVCGERIYFRLCLASPRLEKRCRAVAARRDRPPRRPAEIYTMIYQMCVNK